MVNNTGQTKNGDWFWMFSQVEIDYLCDNSYIVSSVSIFH